MNSSLTIKNTFLRWFTGVCFLMLALLGSHASAQTNYTSAGSGLLSNAANWTPNGIPGVNDTVEILAGNLVTNSTSGTTVSNLTIDTGGTFKIAAQMSVGTITNNGTLTVGTGNSARTLFIATAFVNNGTVTGDTGNQNQLSFNGNPAIFTGITNAVWLGSGDISGGKIQVIVGVSTYLDISQLTTPLKFKSSGTMASVINGALNAGSLVINGNANALCSINVAAGGTFITANPNGIINGTIGTLNFAGAKTLNAAANYVFVAATAQVTAGLPSEVYNLTISNTVSVTLSGATTIDGVLSLASGAPLITSASATPIMANPGSVTGFGYVSGPLSVTFNSPAYQAFSVGKNGNAHPLILNYTSFSGVSVVTVEDFEASMGGTLPASTSQFGARYWAVAQSGATDSTFDLSLDGTGFSPVGTGVILQQGSPDTSYSAFYSAPTYTASSVTSFGNFTLGDYSPGSDMLVFTTAPVTIAAGAASGMITVQLQTSSGTPKNAAANLTVNLTTTSGAGAFKSGATTITSVVIPSGSSSASFVYTDTAGPAMPTITATASGASPATQIETVTVSAATKLVFTTQPVDGFLGAPLAPVTVQIEDAYGNLVSQDGTSVTLALNGGTLASGTTSQVTASGAATFSDFVITTPGSALTFAATSGGLTAGVSTNFNVTSHNIVKAATTIPMNNTTSWLNGVVPAQYDTAVFNNSSVGSSPNNTSTLGGATTWYGVVFTNWTANAGYSFGNDGSVLTLGPAGLIGTNIPHTVTLNNDFLLGAAQLWTWNGTFGPLVFNGNLDNGGFLFTISGNLAMNFAGTINGAGGLTKLGSNVLTLSSTGNTYTGPTTVSNGTLTVNGALVSAVTVGGAGVLGGTGTIASSVTIQSGGQLIPGAGLGVLTINSNLTLQAGSTLFAQVDQTSGGSSQVNGLASVTYGGALVVTNLTGAPYFGETFPLFSAGASSGNFSSISGSPGAGLAWSFNPTNGMLSVVNGPTNTAPSLITVFSPGSISISWPQDHLGWILQGQTNAITVGVSTNWTDIPGTASGTNATIAISPTNPTAFFRLRSP